MNASSDDSREFRVVMRGQSAVVFRPGETLGLQSVPTDCGPVNIGYTTRWPKRADGVTAPGHLWIEIRGNGPSLEQVLNPFANAGLIGLAFLATSTNAAIQEPELEVAFECTAGVTEREYFQSFIPPEGTSLHSARLIDVRATLALINAIQTSKEADRLLRAANQYNIALRNWRFGHATLAVAHLWMALEALTKAKIRAEIGARELSTEDELAASLRVEKKELDATIRRQFLLQGDEECYTLAKKASDGFEHGFLGFDRLSEFSEKIRVRMAAYVRSAILRLAAIEDPVQNTMLSEEFSDPIGPWPLAKYLRGVLQGEGNSLAAEGNEYPFVRWRSAVSKFEFNENGKMDAQFQEQLTPELAAGIQFIGKSFEIWKAG